MKIEFQDIKAKFQIELDYFDKYLIFNETQVSNHVKEVEQSLKEDQIENPNLPMSQMYEEELKKIPSLFYSSSILILFSILESTLNDICQKIIEESNIPISIDSYSGTNYVHKTNIFLGTFGRINFSSIDKNWNEITKFQKLRNNIIHNNSRIIEYEKKKRSFEALLRSLKIYDFNENKNRFYIVNVAPVNKLKENIKSYIESILEFASIIDYVDLSYNTDINFKYFDNGDEEDLPF